MGDNEIPEEERVGRELQRFFLELLKDKNLARYHGGRREYIQERTVARDGYLNKDAEQMLVDGRMHDIEDEILKVTGSAKAVPLFIVSPPY